MKEKIKGGKFYSKAEFTLFEGFEVSFRSVMTFFNGRLKHREDEIIEDTAGEFLRDGYSG